MRSHGGTDSSRPICTIDKRHTHIAALGTMAQGMVHQDKQQHGLSHRRGADAHAGIVTPQRLHVGGGAIDVDRTAHEPDAGGRLDRDGNHQRLPGGDASQDAACMIAGKPARRELIAVFAATLGP